MIVSANARFQAKVMVAVSLVCCSCSTKRQTKDTDCLAGVAVSFEMLEGHWRVMPSPDPKSFSPFNGHEGKIAMFHNGLLSFPGSTINGHTERAVFLGVPANPCHIVFLNAPGTNSWEREGLVKVEGAVMTLSLRLRNIGPPVNDFNRDREDQEVTVLEKIR